MHRAHPKRLNTIARDARVPLLAVNDVLYHETKRRALLAKIQGLGDSWQGPAASALQELYAKWDSDARALMDTLTEISQAMQQAATRYEETESNVTREFS